jgi:Serine/threonine protein kinase
MSTPLSENSASGGFGITYLTFKKNGQKVVVKTLNDKVQQRPDFAKLQEDFLNEALRLAKCPHPHIAKVGPIFQEGHLWCMVMDYIDGGNLADRVVQKGILPEDIMPKILFQNIFLRNFRCSMRCSIIWSSISFLASPNH